MGRAISMENDIQDLQRRVSLVEDALDEALDLLYTKSEEESKSAKKKTNNKGTGKSSKQSDNGSKQSVKEDA
jgi:hypothetical protein